MGASVATADQSDLAGRTLLARRNIAQERAELAPKYGRFARASAGLLAARCEAIGVTPVDLTWRLKDADSIERKLWDTPGDPGIADLSDFCGMRVVVGTLADQATLATVMSDCFQVFKEERKGGPGAGDRFGYNSIHFDVGVHVDRCDLPEWSGLSELRAEIQLRTAFEHAWAERSHELAYKSDMFIPSELDHVLATAAGQVEVADKLIDEFSTQLLDLRTRYQDRAAGDDWVTLPLDPVALELAWDRFPWAGIARAAEPLGYSLELSLAAGDAADQRDVYLLAREAGFTDLASLLQYMNAVCETHGDLLREVSTRARTMEFGPWAIGPEILIIAFLVDGVGTLNRIGLSPRLLNAISEVAARNSK